MRVGIIFLLSALITAVLVVGALMFRDPLPPLIVAVLSFPMWLVTLSVLTRKFSGDIDVLVLQNYRNVSQIRSNTDKMSRL